MSDESRKVFDRIGISILPKQHEFIQRDADNRYPERHGPTEQKRNFSPALRDGIDFWQAHYHLFLTYIAARDTVTSNGNGGTE